MRKTGVAQELLWGVPSGEQDSSVCKKSPGFPGSALFAFVFGKDVRVPVNRHQGTSHVVTLALFWKLFQSLYQHSHLLRGVDSHWRPHMHWFLYNVDVFPASASVTHHTNI